MTPLYGQTVGEDIASVETCVVVVDLLAGEIFVGISAVAVKSERHRVVQSDAFRRAPCGLPPQAAPLFLVGLVAAVKIGIVASAIIEISGDAHAEIVAEQRVLRRRHANRLPLAGLAHDAGSLIVERREGVNIDLTGHRVASVESALRASYYLHAADIG